ncbi:Z-ring formation inhibitor MciZ [Paenibacillus lentus]|uniref:Z-ring formation inhibitor MciZ n=1 Tax=Paenibacillus lentus TaxID=1338368 RepID=A0A3Q8S532_9BACL|nr:Z-ring formation inhibitor MciZ [Paenibacillus lentus]AZK47088.1 Z-ring formation inhibitor MciZ [Paenibacillus lentus]
MKSYFSDNSLRAQGKAWQIRIMLNQWQQQSEPTRKLKDFIACRLNLYSKVIDREYE